MMFLQIDVIPAKAGIQRFLGSEFRIPAYAGMTEMSGFRFFASSSIFQVVSLASIRKPDILQKEQVRGLPETNGTASEQEAE
jgi:hypothetical protein